MKKSNNAFPQIPILSTVVKYITRPTTAGPDISQITEHLYISAWLDELYVNEIRSLDVRIILSMHWRQPAKSLGRAPVNLLWLPTIDSPLTPMPIPSLFKGVEAALPLISEGQRVLVHCRAGIHRSVAMACCVLIGTGTSAEEAMKLVKEQRDIADPYIWYIKSRIKKFELDWHRRDKAE